MVKALMRARSIVVNGKRGNLAKGKIDKRMLVADCLVPCSGYVTGYACSSNSNNIDEDVNEFPRNALH
jgi:hypothetical protein